VLQLGEQIERMAALLVKSADCFGYARNALGRLVTIGHVGSPPARARACARAQSLQKIRGGHGLFPSSVRLAAAVAELCRREGLEQVEAVIAAALTWPSEKAACPRMPLLRMYATAA
jgi:hypothetical protein